MRCRYQVKGRMAPSTWMTWKQAFLGWISCLLIQLITDIHILTVQLFYIGFGYTHIYIYIYIYIYHIYMHTYIIYIYIHTYIIYIYTYIYHIYIYIWVNYNNLTATSLQPHCNLTGIMVNKGNYPKITLSYFVITILPSYPICWLYIPQYPIKSHHFSWFNS